MATVRLRSGDVPGCEIEVPRECVPESSPVHALLDSGEAVPLPNVDAEVLVALGSVLNSQDPERAVASLSVDRISELMIATDYLGFERLFDCLNSSLVDRMIPHKTPESLREAMGLPNDLTPEEREQIVAENRFLATLEGIQMLHET